MNLSHELLGKPNRPADDTGYEVGTACANKGGTAEKQGLFRPL
ncbi:hypothetical protein PNH38_01140 [Anoxybacillus rupiensis]|uniref:Uncharacterized protein n=1 Tax=Anoxybacteroides rupiense TaxID=311460 RepID=A0ABT5VZK2_9BACL|nr:hypothetical protein [Anoxybacillus rupiensis]